MKILIIEDEVRSFTRLKRLLLSMDEMLEIDGPVASVRDVVAELECADKEYNVIFADIRLEDGDVFEAFLQVYPKAPVIFTTAYNEYALEAFRSNGIAYLLKPIVPEELCLALEKARKLAAESNASQDISALLSTLGLKKQNYREHFLVQASDGYTVLNVQDINHIATENGIIRAFLLNGRSLVLEYTLGDIEAQLDPAKFFRANRQYIIGIDSVEHIHFSYNHKLSVRLKGYPNVNIIVSKERAAQLKEWIDR